MLEASDELMQLDREVDLAVAGAEIAECPDCGGLTYDEWCLCSPGLPLDPIKRLEAQGKDITHEEFRKLLDAAGPAAGGER